MGLTFSAYWVASKSFFEKVSIYATVIKRISLSPGLPVTNPLPPFWSEGEEPPDIPTLEDLPNYADVVIIGSGITGAAVAHTLLSRSDEYNSIVMVDSRYICGGASGRNGGHCNEETWADYIHLRERYGEEGVQRIQRFRSTSLKDLLEIDSRYCGGKGDVRNVDALDVFYEEDIWEDAKRKLATWREMMGEGGVRGKAYTHHIWEGEEAQKMWELSSHCVGVIWTKTNIGVLNSYRLITSLLEYLVTTYSKRLSISPNTSVLSIDPPESNGPKSCYTLRTSKGSIRTRHIVHATNAHISHHVPSLRSKVVPVRLTVSAQRPGQNFLPTHKSGMRIWCLYYGKGYDFLAQLPKGPSDGWGNGELIYGGGYKFAQGCGLGEAGNLDDSKVDPQVESHLSGALPVFFGQSNWGLEGRPEKDDKSHWGNRRVKTIWSGIMGFSSDGLPWVGKLTGNLTPRKNIPEGGGEWVSAGYSGEGLARAWGCGRACGMMVLGLEDRKWEELPKEFLITEERIRKAGVKEMFELLEAGS